MKKEAVVIAVLAGCVLSFPVFAADFKPYPGARVDEKATQEARQATGMATMIYTTGDSFDKVYAFYKGIGQEYRMPPSEGPFNLRSGGTLREAFFIFDGAPDLMSSKSWIKVQRPYIGGMKTSVPPSPKYVEDIYEGIRDVTVIVK